MKIDLVSIIQLSMMILLMMTIFAYAVYSYRRKFDFIRKSVLDKLYLLKLNYTKKLSLKDYAAFEKYGVWRYSARF